MLFNETCDNKITSGISGTVIHGGDNCEEFREAE